jgi:hypothetical protein
LQEGRPQPALFSASVAGAELDVVGARLLQALGADEIQRERVGLTGSCQLAALPLENLRRIERRSGPATHRAGVYDHCVPPFSPREAPTGIEPVCEALQASA